MKKQILSLIKMEYSYDQVIHLYKYGHISKELLKAWVKVWEWASVKYGGKIAEEQDRFFDKYGAEKFYAKINKTRRAFGLQKLGKKLNFPLIN